MTLVVKRGKMLGQCRRKYEKIYIFSFIFIVVVLQWTRASRKKLISFGFISNQEIQ